MDTLILSKFTARIISALLTGVRKITTDYFEYNDYFSLTDWS